MDAVAGVTLRATSEGDLAAMVEQCRDPEMIRWTTVPPLPMATSFATPKSFWPESLPAGQAVNASAGPSRRNAVPSVAPVGASTLRLQGDGVAEVGFGLHPEARGRGS